MKKEVVIKQNKVFYNGICLEELAKKYGTPLRVTMLEMIKNRIEELKEEVSKAIKKSNYQGDFIYLNANKATYGKEEIDTACRFADGLETSSYHDLLLTRDIMVDNGSYQDKYIVCNGYKKQDYLDEIIDLNEKGFKIITIIDNLDEYKYYKEHAKKKLQVGLRIHLSSLYTSDKNELNDRFGINEEEYQEIIDEINKISNLDLKVIHFHQRGFDFEEKKYLQNIERITKYYIESKIKCSSINMIDLGGGTPLPIDNDFNYEKWANQMINVIKEMCEKANVPVPHILSENGKYSQKDAQVNIYEIVGVKNTDEIPWYIVDGSLLIAMPEMYALGEPILAMPINNLDCKMVKTRLAGITCDCDDVFFDHEKGYFMMPQKEKDNNIYLGLLGTGSYQNSMNGKGGIHHCLLPEEIDLVVDLKGQIKVRKELQTLEEMKKIMRY